MYKHLAVAVIAAILGSSAASAADYYVVRDKSTKKCKVVEAKPSGTTWVQVGPVAFKTRDEAQKQVAVICKEKSH
jgi:hypothetical protein